MSPLSGIKAIKIFLPAGKNRPPEVIRLPDQFMRDDLAVFLQDHHLKDFETILGLSRYGADGNPQSLNHAAVSELLDSRQKHPNRRNPTDASIFSGCFKAVGDHALARIKEETNSETGRKFVLREEEEEEEACDFESDQPISMRLLRKEVDDFISAKSIPASKNREVPRSEAERWATKADPVTGRTLDHRLREVIREAEFRGIIYHEPHHDLCPGMILIDEIFLAMVKAVADTGAKPGSTLTEAVEDQLLQFVIGVGTGAGESPGAVFGPYILRAGDFPCAGGQKTYHVDPTRIELFLDDSNPPKIVTTSVIVGAWAGGTHSLGHTS
jgi:hypothetical protein